MWSSVMLSSWIESLPSPACLITGWLPRTSVPALGSDGDPFRLFPKELRKSFVSLSGSDKQGVWQTISAIPDKFLTVHRHAAAAHSDSPVVHMLSTSSDVICGSGRGRHGPRAARSECAAAADLLRRMQP